MNKHCHRLVFDRSRSFCVAVAETVAAAGKSAAGERHSRGVRVCAAAALAVAAFAVQGQGLAAGSALTGVAPRPTLPPAAATPKPPPGAAAALLPTGATIVKGAATIGVVGGDMSVNQSTGRLVTDWQSFSIGAGNSVRFVQPSTSAVALNRVTGNDPSAIFGSLVANGHVYLQNANGVYFAPGSQVSVGSLVATTLNVNVGEFMLGKLRLSGGSETSGSVANAGSIVAAPGGHVVLAGPMVSNSGSIATPGGTAALVAGNAVDVDPLGSGLLSIRVPVAAMNAHLAQSGSISADGGAVLLAAAANDAALRTVMQVGGVVRARSIESRDGQIVLSGGASGAVMVDGQLDASAGAGGQGGTIKVLGDLVGVTGNAKLDASGGAGGGTILVGGNWQGKGPEANASGTYVGSGVVLDASATGQGDGGTVVVWADGHTNYFGQANARGGAHGGDGGKVEVSGKTSLNFQGGADLTAAHGKTGSLLLDPDRITVGTVADEDGTPPPGDDLDSNIFLAQFPGANSQITATRVGTLLDTADVTLQSQFTIDFTAPLTVPAGGAATTLALQTAELTIGAPMTLNNASLTATTTPTFTTQGITVNAPVTSNNSVSLTSPTIIFNAPLTATNVSLTTFGDVSQTAAGIVSATNLTLTGSGVVNLDAAPNQVRNLTMSNLDFLDISFTVTNPVGVPLSIAGTATRLSLATTNTDIVQPPGGAIVVDGGEGVSLAISTVGSGNVTLPNAANDISGGVDFNVTGNIVLRDTGFLRAQGTATGDVTLVTDGVFNLDGNISGRIIDITSVGFQAASMLLLPAPGGRFLIRSSDWEQDNFNSPVFGVGPTDINFMVLGGFSGTAPTTGNGYFTNRTGTIAPPNTDNPPVSKVYDGTPGFAFSQTGAAATGTLEGIIGGPGPIPFPMTDYSITSSGAFTDKNAGVDKGHTVGASNNTNALLSSGGGNIPFYGMQFAGYTRAPGVHSPGTPGNPVSEITQRPITSTGVDGIDRVYNQAPTVGVNVAGASLVGTIGGDIVALSGTGATGTMADKNAGVNKPIAVTGLTLTGVDAGNYTVTDASSANVTITSRPITSTGLDGIDRVYDGTTTVAVNGAGGSLVGVLGSDAVGMVTGGASGSVANKNVGAAKPVTIVGVGLNGIDAGNYTVSDASAATVAITPRPLTALGLDGVDRVYNGGTAVGVNAGGASLAGTIVGDAVSLVATGATGTLADKNVGTDKPVTVGGLSLAGTDAGNYTVAAAAGATATITPLGITSSGFTGVDRVYDATTVVAVNASAATLTGVIGGDSVAVAGGTGSVANKNVGTAKPVTVGGITLSGIDAGNYTVTDASGANVTITQRPITSTGLDGIDRVYDGTTVVAINGSGAALVGVLGSDVVGVATGGASGSVADKNVGAAKPVTIVGVGLNGIDAGNYTVSDASAATVAITPRPLTALGLDGVDRVYNGGTAVGVNAGGASLAGTIVGDAVSLVATGATGTLADKNVGTDKPVTVGGLSLAGTDAGNYTVAAAAGATATITPRPITSTGLDGVDRAYDGTTIVAVNGSGAALVGVLGGDSVGVATGGASGSIADKNVGAAKPVTIVGVGLNGVDAGNYTVSDASAATVAITPRPLTALGLDGVDRVYNGGTAVGVNATGASLAGTIGGDAVSLVATGATGTLADKNVGTDRPVAVGGLGLAGTDAGNYTVAAAAGATATITPLGITSSGFTGVDRVYDATTVVAVNASAATLTGVIGGDSVAVAGGTGSVANKNVGTAKPVTVGGITLSGIDAGNYTVTDASGAFVTITPLGITSTGVSGVDRSYDGTSVVAVNTGGATLNGTIAGDSVALVTTGATGTMANKNTGVDKPVSVGGLALAGADAANYRLVDASNATVDIAALVLRASGISATDRVVDGTTTVQVDASAATVTGVLPGDTIGIDPTGATGSVATPDPGANKPVIVTGIVLTGPDAANYAIAPVPVTPTGSTLTVSILSVDQGNFEDVRFTKYLQAVSDAQEPFRRAMAEALASGFGKENIRKQLQRGLVFETGLAPPAVDIIEPAARPQSCTPPGGADLNCGR